MLCSDAPTRRSIANSASARSTAPRVALGRKKPFQAPSSACPESGPSPAAPRRGDQHAHPSAQRSRRRGMSCSHGYRRTTATTSYSSPSGPKLAPCLREQNLRLRRQARHVGRSPPSRGTRTCARGPPSSSSGGPACRCSTPGPSCRSAHASPRPPRPLCTRLFALYFSAPPAVFINLQSWSCPPSFQCCTWQARPAVARAAAAAFLAQS